MRKLPHRDVLVMALLCWIPVVLAALLIMKSCSIPN